MTAPDARDHGTAPTASWRPPIIARPKIRLADLRDRPDEAREFGVIEKDGHVRLHVGSAWPVGDLAVAEYFATALRDADVVEIAGLDEAAIRAARKALRAVWDEQDREARRELAAQIEPHPFRCGDRRTKSGLPCRRPAGWATDTPGEGPCRDHGGTTSGRDAAKEQLLDCAAQVREQLRQAQDSGIPLTAEERRTHLLALRKAAAAYRRPRRSLPSVSSSDAP